MTILNFLVEELKRPILPQSCKFHKYEQIFPYTKRFFEHDMKRGTVSEIIKKYGYMSSDSLVILLIELNYISLSIVNRLEQENAKSKLTYILIFFSNKKHGVSE